MLHELKTWPQHFVRIYWGEKTCEVRKNDRDFCSGDTLHLNEYDPETAEYSGRKVRANVTHVLHGGQFGIAEGYCVMSIKIISLS